MFGTRTKGKFKYSITSEQEQGLLEQLHNFNSLSMPLGWSQAQSYNLDSPEYLRGIADTLPDGARLNRIADLLQNVNDMLQLYITIEEEAPDGDEGV